MTDFTQDLFARRRNASDGNTRVVSAGKVWYDSITNTIRVSDGHTPGGQIVTGQSGSYTLPTATPSVKGGVQLGANVIASGATIDVLSPTRVSQLENDSNYLSGSVLAGYATETFVTTRGYITSAALTSGNANVIAANSRIASIDANIGAYQIWANANVAGLGANAGTQATSINSINANVGAYQSYANTSISTLDANLGVRFTTLNTLHANVGAYQTWANGRITTIDANIGTLSLGNISTQANLGAYQTWANGRVTTLDANLGTATTNISNLVTQANANTAAYLTTYTGNVSAGNVLISNSLRITQAGAGNQYSLIMRGAGSGDQWAFTIGDTAGQNNITSLNTAGSAYAPFSVNGSTFTIGTTGAGATASLFVASSGNVVINSTTSSSDNTSGALVVKGGVGVASNLTVGGNVIVGINITPNYYNSAGAGKGIDIVATTANKVGYLNLVGGTSSSGLLTFGNISSVQAVITTGTDNSITFATKSPTTGANAASAALSIYSDQTAQFFSNLTVSGNATIASNLSVTQSGLFRGPYNESSTISGVFIGNTGSGTPSPRIGFFNGNTQQNWQIDNYGGEFRWFVPGSTKLNLYPNGNLNVTGSVTISGKKAVNGPAFSAYAAAVGQTITSGSQQKVLFQTEEFDTDNCYASSRFTPTVEGYYQLNAEVRLDGATGTGEMMIVIWKNGAEHKRGTNQSGTQIASNFWAMTVSSLVYANGTTDYFEIYVQQGSGGNVTVTAVGSPNITWFNGAMVRGA